MQSGLTATLTDQVSGPARQISSELNAISESANNIGNSLDPGVLDDYLNKLNQVGEKYNSISRDINRSEGGGGSGVGFARSAVSGAGGIVSGMGSGDIGAVATQGAQGASSMLQSMGMSKAGIAAMIAAGTIGVANQASKAYEARMPEAMQMTALMGKFTSSFQDNTDNIDRAMKDASDAVSRFGKSYEEGAGAVSAYLTAGGSERLAFAEAGRSALYSRAYGANMQQAAQFQGVSARYGGGGQVLDIINGLMARQGLGPGQYDELLQGMSQIFQSSLSQGITKGVEGIATSAEYFGRAGETYRGGLGAGFLQGMDQAAMGATNLSRQEDIFLFRAASSMTGGNFLDTMKTLEQGFTGEQGVDLFQNFMKEITSFTGGGSEETIKQIRNVLGTTYTQAEDLFNLYQEGGQALDKGSLVRVMSEAVGESLQSGYLGQVEEMKATLTEGAGRAAFGVKAGGVEIVNKTLTGIQGVVESIDQKLTGNQEVATFVMNNDILNARMQDIRAGAEYLPSGESEVMYELGNQYQAALGRIRKDPNVTEDALTEFARQFTENYETNGISKQEAQQLIILLQAISENTGVSAASASSPEEIEIEIPRGLNPFGGL